MVKSGTVYLVGAGPGDPGLITLRGLEILRAADVVVYDRLASSELLLEARPDARLIYVGKEASRHALSQEEINQLLGDEAAAGHSVCRLKGGDPFLFGRGGEEASHLVARKIPFLVVPGVTSAIAAPAYAGIPVTDRREGSSVAIVTGHEEVDKTDNIVDWKTLARATDTLVILMGMKNLPAITAELLAAGRPGDTPAAAVRWGTTGRQQILVSDLANLADEVDRQKFRAPAVLVIGNVVKLREELAWFDRRPLLGLRVLVPRPRHQAGALAGLLREAGAEPVVCPLIRIEPLAIDPAQLRELIAARWDWLLFTSANTVAAFTEQLLANETDWRAFAGARLGAIGPGTARALQEAGLRADFMPSRAIGEGLAQELPEVASGTRILIPRAEDAPDPLPDILQERGANVTIVPVYRTVPDPRGAELMVSALEQGRLEVVTFTSASTVHAAVSAVGAKALAKSQIACIGPTTANAAREYGLEVAIEAQTHTLPGLVSALEAYFAAPERRGILTDNSED